jgi:hypothetical protein
LNVAKPAIRSDVSRAGSIMAMRERRPDKKGGNRKAEKA